MSATDRLRLLTSFVRFMLEMAHQVAVTMATDLDPPHADGAEKDDLTFMQTTNILADKTRILATSLQRDLESLVAHRRQKIVSLLREIHNIHGSAIHQTATDEMQNILAMLVVFRDEPASDFGELPDDMDNEWARGWYAKLRGFFQQTSTATSSTASTMVDLSSQAPQGSTEDAGNNDQALVNQRQAEELRREEDRIMAAALALPPAKRRRLQLDVTMSSGRETPCARLHAPAPGTSIHAQIHLAISTTTANDTTHDTEEQMDTVDEAALMQSNRPATRTLLEALQPGARLRVNRQVRLQLMARLQRLLRECHILMREQRDLLTMFTDQEDELGATNTTATSTNEELAEFYLNNLQAHIDNLLSIDEDVDPYDVVTQLAEGLDPQFPPRRHRLQPVDTYTRTSMVGTEHEVQQLAQDIIDDTNNCSTIGMEATGPTCYVTSLLP